MSLARGGLPLAVAVALGAAAVPAGCSRPRAEARRLPAWVFHASRTERSLTLGAAASSRLAGPSGLAGRPRIPRAGLHGKSEAADLVAAALQDSGLRFGTDGTVGALWGYLGASHTTVAPPAARAGDIVFFDLDTPATSSDRCGPPSHVGIALDVATDGRITFVEARGGRVRSSFVDPARPRMRRDASGEIRNSFLRPKRIEDPSDLPIFAGEMLCGILRPPK